MGLPQYSIKELIANIKRRCSVPTSQLTFEDEDWALLANDELQNEVVPLIMSTREEYFVDHIDIPIPADGIIHIPEQAVGEKLRSVCFLTQSSPEVLINIPRLDIDVIAGVSGGYNMNNVIASGFYVEGDKLRLYPNRGIPQNRIRIYFYKRTLVLATPSQYGRVKSVNRVTNTVVLDYVPTNWVTGTKLNSVKSVSPFNTINPEIEVVGTSFPSVILNSVDDINEGDYISELGFSAVPQVPIEAMGYLAQLTAAKALESLGDRPGMEVALKKAEALKKALLVMVSQRVDGSVKKVINPNGGFRRGLNGRRKLGYW